MQPNPDFWRGRRVCVTGGTGFLGYHLCRQLLDLGARIQVLAIAPKDEHPLRKQHDIACFWGDVRDTAKVREAVVDCQIVFHTAGTVAVWGKALREMHDIHVKGTQTLLEAAADARVVHTSSLVAVGGTRDGTPLSEDAPFHLERVKIDYVLAKRTAEEVALAAAAKGQDVVVTNPGYLVGPDDHENSIMGRFCVRTWTGNMAIAPPGGWDLADVRDVATGHLLAAEHAPRGRRFILGGENVSVADFIKRLAPPANMRPRAFPKISVSLVYATAFLTEAIAAVRGVEPYPSFQHVALSKYYWYGDSSRAQRELGYAARPLDETLRDTFRWYTDRGNLPLNAIGRWWMRPASS